MQDTNDLHITLTSSPQQRSEAFCFSPLAEEEPEVQRWWRMYPKPHKETKDKNPSLLFPSPAWGSQVWRAVVFSQTHPPTYCLFHDKERFCPTLTQRPGWILEVPKKDQKKLARGPFVKVSLYRRHSLHELCTVSNGSRQGRFLVLIPPSSPPTPKHLNNPEAEKKKRATCTLVPPGLLPKAARRTESRALLPLTWGRGGGERNCDG